MMKTLIPLALILAPAGVPLLAPAPAQAQQADASVRISYADLDLSRAADRSTLDRRIDKALGKICPAERPGYLTPAPEAQRCQALARQQIAAARQQALAQRSAPVRISANP